MVFDKKSFWCHFLDSFETLFQFKNLSAGTTKKVVVMAFVGAFVARRFSRNFDCHHLSIVG